MGTLILCVKREEDIGSAPGQAFCSLTSHSMVIIVYSPALSSQESHVNSPCALSLLAGAVFLLTFYTSEPLSLVFTSGWSQYPDTSGYQFNVAEKTDLYSLMLFGKLFVSGQIYTPVALWVRDPTSEFMHPARIYCSTHKGFLSGKQNSIIMWPSHLIFHTRPV